jgi:hypothetical protein
MRPLILIALAAPLALVACGGGSSEPQRVYVQPSTASVPSGGTTVVVPPGSSAKICPVGTVC